MPQRRPYACMACSKRKRKCVFPTPAEVNDLLTFNPELEQWLEKPRILETCLGCQRRRLMCSGPTRPSSEFVEALSMRNPSSESSSVGPSSLSWTLATQQLSYSLTYHLVSLHMRHRPPRLFAGLLEQRWVGMGVDVASVNGKVGELSPVRHALAALGMADGARLSTHSAIIGPISRPVPRFGTFTSVDSNLIGLGNRRRNAVDYLNAKAMDCIEIAIDNFGESDPAKKMQLLWLATAVMVETPHSRSWCRSMSVRCATYIVEYTGQGNVVESHLMKLMEEAYYVAMAELLSSATFGISTNMTQHEFVTAIPYIAYPPLPIYYPTLPDYDMLLTPSPNATDLTPFVALTDRILTPWRLRLPKIAFLHTYGRRSIGLAKLSTLIWTAVQEIADFTDNFYNILMADPRYLEVERVRGSATWMDYTSLVLLLRHLFISEYILASILIGCHWRIVSSASLGKARTRILGASQAQCYMMLRRIDFVCGLRDTVLVFQELEQASMRVRQIVSAPESGPCSDISLTTFPHLLKTFQFLSFSNGDCADFLLRHGSVNHSSSPTFANGRSLSELPPQGLVLPRDSTESAFTEIHALYEKLRSPAGTQEVAASNLVNSTLDSIADGGEASSDEEDAFVDGFGTDAMAARMVESALRGVSD